MSGQRMKIQPASGRLVEGSRLDADATASRMERRTEEGQDEVDDSDEEAAEDERQSERVDGQKAIDDGVGGSGALGGVGVGQQMAECVQRVERPERDRAAE